MNMLKSNIEDKDIKQQSDYGFSEVKKTFHLIVSKNPETPKDRALSPDLAHLYGVSEYLEKSPNRERSDISPDISPKISAFKKDQKSFFSFKPLPKVSVIEKTRPPVESPLLHMDLSSPPDELDIP